MDVLLRLGPECNQKCIFCNVTDCDYLTTYQAIRWLRTVPKNVSLLSITGGEPTLRKDLFLIIKEASKLKTIKNVLLQTNGALASYKEYADKLKKANLDMATVAFHSHNESMSNKLTRSDLWYNTVKGIKNLLSTGIMVFLNPVINKLNYSMLPQYVKFVKEEFKDINHISFSFVQPCGRAWKNRWIMPSYTEVMPYLKKAVKYCNENKINVINPYCGFPMCLFPESEKTSDEYKDTDLNDKLERESLDRVVKNKIKASDCKQCIYFNQCNGVWINYKKIYGLSELKPIKRGKV